MRNYDLDFKIVSSVNSNIEETSRFEQIVEDEISTYTLTSIF